MIKTNSYCSFINAINQKSQTERWAAVPLTHTQPEEEEFLKCQNSTCGKSFSKTLKTIDLQVGDGEIYEACPYCLSRAPASGIKLIALPENATAKTVGGCPHHPGYLHERTEKNQIPDNCMMCTSLVRCMLKGPKE